MLSRAREVADAIERDPRFDGWALRARGGGHLEAARGDHAVVLAWPDAWEDAERLDAYRKRARAGHVAIALCGTEEELADGMLEAASDLGDLQLLSLPISPLRLSVFLGRQVADVAARAERAAVADSLERARYENDLLITIGRALSQQRDIDSLLELILERARDVTGADAGSVYVVEGDTDDVARRTLRFTVSQNDSLDIEVAGHTMLVSPSSIVGRCVLSGEVVNIPDLYDLDDPGGGNNEWGFVHDRSFDERTGYQTRSMVTVPMISARDQVIGVIQLINKRAEAVQRLTMGGDFGSQVVPFDDVSINYATALASQAGIALENGLLYDEVKTLFEGFVRASVTAIESRDPTTSGHSERVAGLTVELAKVTDRSDTGTYAAASFTPEDLKEIEYAGLLHDFGKVGVREHVLVKPKKLYSHERDRILARFEFIRKAIEIEQLDAKLRYLLEADVESRIDQLAGMDADAQAQIRELDEFLEFILQVNEPSVLEQGGFERLSAIADRSYEDSSGVERPYLVPEETAALQIARGSLTAEERREIESHVVHTFAFLEQIPWGRAFRNVPEIAGAHHEKLDGSGYPEGRAASAIPLPAKMMTISDIYDALTAADRPYKKAVPVDKALNILRSEVDRGFLDRDLFQLFLDAKVYERVLVRRHVPR